MKTKQEQIEEMAVIGCVRNPQAHTAEECAKCDFKQGQSQEIIKQINQIGQDISRLWGDTTKALLKLIKQLQQKKDELDKATERALAITADAVLKNYR